MRKIREAELQRAYVRELQALANPLAQAQTNQGLLSQAYAQQAFLNAQNVSQIDSAFEGFCNCVPSRGQVWAANRQGD